MANLNPFSKVLQKQAGRAKERLLQNFGKADRTTDEDFDLHVKNFSKQQSAVLRLQKEFKYYHQCLRAMQMARRNLMDTVSELYEPCWDGVEEFLIKSDISNRTFEEFCDNLNCEILAPVGSYLCQFPEITNKISKRNRKLLDYDNCRHNLQNLETMKKKEDSKLTKAREQLEDARNNFETINNELHEELPTLYDGRVAFFATHLHCLFSTEYNYHTKDAVICSEMGELLSNLKKAYEEGSFTEAETGQFPATKKDSSETEYFLARERHSLSSDTKSPDNKVEGEQLLKALYKSFEENAIQEESPSGSTTFSTPTTTIERNASLDLDAAAAEEEKIVNPEEKAIEEKAIEEKAIEEKTNEEKVIEEKVIEEKVIEANKDSPKKEKNHVLPLEDAAGDAPVQHNAAAPNVLYQVQGTYKYIAEDADELSFNVGDVIDVVEYDDPEEQEEGWLMGIFDGKKGLFPANFTSRI